MRDDLVTAEIEVRPMRAGAASVAAEQVEVEAARGALNPTNQALRRLPYGEGVKICVPN
jgi:hypothetical protein